MKIDLHVKPKFNTSNALGMRDTIASWISTGSERRLAKDMTESLCEEKRKKKRKI